jgi:hypothetical protein
MAADNGDPKVSTTVFVGLLGTVMLVAVMYFASALYDLAQYREIERKIYAARAPEYDALRAEQQANLSTYRWVNQQEGVVAIPIERAIELTVKDLKGDRRSGTIEWQPENQSEQTTPDP